MLFRSARERFSPEDCKKLEEMLSVVSHELMPEMDMLTRVQAEAPERVAEDEKTNA